MEGERGERSVVAAAMVAGCLFYALAAGTAHGAPDDLSPYMGGPVELVEAPNGAIINKVLFEDLPKTAWTAGPEIEEPVDGVYVLGGYLISACIVVEAEDGLIVFDTGDNAHDGEILLKEIRQKISRKPIKVIVYGHSHYCFGAAVMAEGNEDVMVIGHPDLNDVVRENLTGGGAPAYFPEIGPLLTGRALLQFNYYLPDKGPDAWFSSTNINPGEMPFLPVNRPVEDGEIMDVLGIKMQFFTRYGADDKVHTTVWLPERKICIENLLWSSTPNMYSIRGDVFRDAREWAAGVRLVRSLEPEVLVGFAHRPLVGKESIQETLNAYLDGISFVLDQTLRGILGGYDGEDLRHMIVLPDYLRADPHNLESYGEVSFQPPAIYNHAVGWYNNDAASIFRPTPVQEAERLVDLIGGRDKVLAAAREAFERKEYAWAAQLVNYVYKLDPTDADARALKAEVLRQLAYICTGANARSHLLSQALALEGKVNIMRLIPPSPEAIVGAEPGTFVDYFRVRLAPGKSGETNAVLGFQFTDANYTTVALHVRRAVAEYVDDPDDYHKPIDVMLMLTREAWAKLYLSAATVGELVEAGELTVVGDLAEAERLVGLFDTFKPERNFVVAPHLHD